MPCLPWGFWWYLLLPGRENWENENYENSVKEGNHCGTLSEELRQLLVSLKVSMNLVAFQWVSYLQAYCTPVHLSLLSSLSWKYETNSPFPYLLIWNSYPQSMRPSQSLCDWRYSWSQKRLPFPFPHILWCRNVWRLQVLLSRSVKLSR